MTILEDIQCGMLQQQMEIIIAMGQEIHIALDMPIILVIIQTHSLHIQLIPLHHLRITLPQPIQQYPPQIRLQIHLLIRIIYNLKLNLVLLELIQEHIIPTQNLIQ